MVEYTEQEDYFSDGDSTAPKNLPEKTRLFSEIADVDISAATPGNWRKFERPLDDGRMQVPIITFNMRAIRFPNGADFTEEYYRTGKADVWVGKEDKGSRHALYNLITKLTALSEAEVKSMPIREAALKLKGAKVTAEVKWQEGDTATFQKFIKIRVPKDDELAANA